MSSLARVRDGLRALVRPSGPPTRPSWRGMVWDGLLGFVLATAAVISGGIGGDSRQIQGRVVGPDDLAGIPPHPDLPPMPPVVESQYQPFLPIGDDKAAWTLAMYLVAMPLVWRRRYPLAVLWISLAFAPIVGEDLATLRLDFYVAVIAAYSAAVFSPYRYLALFSLAPTALLYAGRQSDALPTVPDSAVPFLVLLPIAFAADGLRRWRRRADEHQERMAVMESEQVEALRRATEVERARIARELHDVVTHNVSVMVIQAGAARKVLASEPDAAREALLAVESGGRAAMAELRQVMGLLSPDGATPEADLAPQPGLDRLAALVGRVRDAGLPVELATSGTPRPVPSGVELAAYRVVQEALTNTVKHAAGANACVLVEYGDEELRVEVTDTGGRAGTGAAGGNGRGLLGLRERLAVHGGTLQVGPRVSGGYRVDARIPLSVEL